jgi:HD-GYP domain-containing protein (c-di-GMP phosphodiesterase class II)
MGDDELRLADLLAALSVTSDLAMGQAPEKAIRACILATEVARHMALPEPDVADAYWTTLLKHLGCTATTHEEAGLFGPDELGGRPVAERTDVGKTSDTLAFLATVGRGAGLSRARYLAKTIAGGSAASAAIQRAVCEVASHTADRLGMGEGVRGALGESLERWDGKGAPGHLSGDDIAIAARVAEPATQAVIFDRLGGHEAATAMVERRAGGWFDPAVAEAVRAVGPRVLEQLAEDDPWRLVLDAEPEPVRRLPADRLDRVAQAFGDLVDLKSTFTLGHSSRVAELAGAAAERIGLPDPGAVRRAAWFHDLGRAAVATGTWEKRGALTTSEWEQIRLHPYQTERILARSTTLATLARIAGMHHERQDGSGYHHGASGGEIPIGARLLAVADIYAALTQDRPQRPARPPDQATAALDEQMRSGALDPECVRAVLDVVGQRRQRARTPWPSGLSDREVEVIRLVARGASNREVADVLVISPRTAEHHVQHVYTKIGVSTRAAAAMFAMEHGLLRHP